MAKESKQQRDLENINDLNDRRITAEKQLFNVLRKNSKELETADKKHIKAMDLITESQKGFKNLLVETKDIVKDTVGIFVSLKLAQDLFKAAQGVVAMEKSLYRASINAGKTSEEGKKVVGIAAEMRMKFGATAEAAEKVLKTFVKGQYKGNIKEAASASYQFARAMDISEETVAKNTLELQKWGQIGPKAATAMYADIMKVAQGYGLTSEGAEGVIKATTKLSGYMRAFGKSETEIQKMNLGLAKMVSSMEKVGVSAQDALAIVDQLLDPEKIEENIPAYAALGISITDAINGNIDPDQITAGMKEVGNKLKEMGPIAGAAYAKAMGISYKNAIKSVDLEQITEEAMTPQETAAEQMKQMTENTKNLTEKLNDFINKIQGLIQSLGPLFMAVISSIIPKIVRKISEGLSKSVKNSLENGMKEGTEEGEKSVLDHCLELQKKAKIKINAEVDLKEIKKEMRQKKKKEIKLKKSVTTIGGRKNAEEEVNKAKEENLKLIKQATDLELKQTALNNARVKAQEKINEISKKGNSATKEESELLLKAYENLHKATEEYDKQEVELNKIKGAITENAKVAMTYKKALKETAGMDLKPTFKEAFERAKQDTLDRALEKKTTKQEAKAKKGPNKLTKTLVNWKNEGKGIGKFIGKRFVNEANKVDLAKPLKDIGGTVGEWGKSIGRNAAEIISKAKVTVATVSGKIAGSKVGRATGAVTKGVKKVAKGAASGVGGIVKALGKLGPIVGIGMFLVSLLMKLEPVQRAIEIVMKKVGEILKKVGEKLQPIFTEITNVVMDLLDGLMPLIMILAKMLVPLLKIMLLPLKALTWLIQKLTHTQSKNNVSLDENTEQMKKDETKPAQIKRNEDGTLSASMATVKSEESSGASYQNTSTETNGRVAVDSDLSKKISIISEQVGNLSKIIERYIMYNLSKEAAVDENAETSKQVQTMKMGLKAGLKGMDPIEVKITNGLYSLIGNSAREWFNGIKGAL